MAVVHIQAVVVIVLHLRFYDRSCADFKHHFRAGSAPPEALMFNKCVYRRPIHSWWERSRRIRNIRIGYPAIGFDPSTGNIAQIGDVVRCGPCIVNTNMEGRKTGAARSVMKIKIGHHFGEDLACFDGIGSARLPLNIQFVYLDIRKVRRCSVDRQAFHSFVWPRMAGEAR